YEIRDPNGTPTVFQQGSYAPDASHRWMGSIAMDHSGDIALGYSVSSDTVYPAVRYTGRVPSDPLGTLQAEAELQAGAGAQTAAAPSDTPTATATGRPTSSPVGSTAAMPYPGPIFDSAVAAQGGMLYSFSGVSNGTLIANA